MSLIRSTNDSLADHMDHSYIPNPPSTLAVALGANLPGPHGEPSSTLKAVRPIIERTIKEWIECAFREAKGMRHSCDGLRFRWSPLYETEPIGGPGEQPAFVNAALVVDGPKLSDLKPSYREALKLLRLFLTIEKQFGRDREASDIRWGPRTLDIDLLAWGALQVQSKYLTLPHPRMIERSFVIIPLGAALNEGEHLPRQITHQADWLK